MASGLRINSASDDPAGLALSERVKTDIKVKNSGLRNINEGISVLQIADAAIEQIVELQTRMVELAEQASSGSLSNSQRETLNLEYKALDTEIRRIADSTTFNGINILKGSNATSGTYEQLTNTSGLNIGLYYEVSADGKIVTYRDNNDGYLKQLNLETNETVLITNQVTSGTKLVASASGNVIVFQSTANITGENASGRNQLFKYDALTSQITQVTNAQAAGELYDFFGSFAISADGTAVVFATGSGYVDGGTKEDASGTRTGVELVVANLETGTINTAGLPDVFAITGAASLSANGEHLVFSTSHDLTGGNEDENFEIFTLDLTDIGATVKQVTDTSGVTSSYLTSIDNFAVTNEGDVFFISDVNFSGENSTGSSQLFHYSASDSAISQLTNNTSGSGTVLFFAFNSDATSFYLASDNNIANSGNSALNFFRYDTSVGELKQTTNLPNSFDFSGQFVLSADGYTLIRRSSENPTGQNPDGNNELFRLNITPKSYQLNINSGSGSGSLSNIATFIAPIDGTLRGLGNLSLASQSSASGALNTGNENITRLSRIRGEIGAGLSRLEAAANVASAVSTELNSAYSRIIDIDVAAETTNLIKKQIAQNAATAILAQANLQPQAVLVLLGITRTFSGLTSEDQKSTPLVTAAA